MKIEFWGTRGSLPVSMRGDSLQRRIIDILKLSNHRTFKDDQEIQSFVENELPFSLGNSYGGSSPCVELHTNNDEYVICDMGSGLREFGQRFINTGGLGRSSTFHFVMSHMHWDHIMGFPFFTPAYIPGNKIHIHGCHERLEEAFKKQQSDPCFPVDWHQLGADIEFHLMQPGESYSISGFSVKPLLQRHHGDSFGYRFERDGKAVVYSTDCEHKLGSDSDLKAYVEFIDSADLVIFDAMYSLADVTTVKEDWGHSSNIVGVDLCRRGNVKHYCMFHHEPIYDDGMIETVLKETLRYEEITRSDKALQISSAYDGMIIEI